MSWPRLSTEKGTLPGFGTFDLRHRVGRTGRNPQTGEAKKLAQEDLIPGAEIQGTIPMWQWIGEQGATTFSYGAERLRDGPEPGGVLG